MCIIAFALGTEASLPLLVVANRDERRSRPTAPATVWSLSNGTRVLAGRDLIDGGTWMGCADNGRVAMLTNIRPEKAQAETAPKSRGALCADWLAGGPVADWLEGHRGVDYGGCNLVLGDLKSSEWLFLRNRPEGDRDDPDNNLAPRGDGWFYRVLAPGLYVLSNATLDTAWPKSVRLRAAVTAAMSRDGRSFAVPPSDAAQRELRAALRDSSRHPIEAAAGDRGPYDVAALSALSSCFVDWPEHDYGTRSSTLMWANADETTRGVGHVTLREWTYGQHGEDQPTSGEPIQLRMALAPINAVG